MAEPTRYAKLVNGRPDFAGAVITLPDRRRVANPTEAHLLAAGYKPYLDEPPTTDAEHYAAPTGWEDRDGAIRRTYEVRELPPPPPRTFSKYRLVSALMAENLWTGVKAWIERTEGAYDLYLAAEDISEDEPLLSQGIAALKSELGITDEQVESILAAATIGGAP